MQDWSLQHGTGPARELSYTSKPNQGKPEKKKKVCWSPEATKTESASTVEEAIVLRENSLANSSNSPRVPWMLPVSFCPIRNQEAGKTKTR